MDDVLIDEALTRRVIGAFYRVYNALGFGVLEAVYARALTIELRHDGLHVQTEVPIEVRYHGEVVGNDRADHLVEGRLVLELKVASSIQEQHRAQLVNCLRATRLDGGLVLSFGPKPQFWRVIGRLPITPPAGSRHAPR